ncbi:hypothetical protein V1264_015069 [Littorina saxatilis]|uniref:Uncharacterized protein n=1 Tax=Littorina saxatilis TaxID=31220 RepID=A0AAN9BK74_9CAEN
MRELAEGSGVYVFPHTLIDLRKLKSGESAARHLLSVFYTTPQIVAAGNLTGANHKGGISAVIVKAMNDYVMQHFETCKSAQVMAALRNKISAAVSSSSSAFDVGGRARSSDQWLPGSPPHRSKDNCTAILSWERRQPIFSPRQVGCCLPSSVVEVLTQGCLLPKSSCLAGLSSPLYPGLTSKFSFL